MNYVLSTKSKKWDFEECKFDQYDPGSGAFMDCVRECIDRMIACGEILGGMYWRTWRRWDITERRLYYLVYISIPTVKIK